MSDHGLGTDLPATVVNLVEVGVPADPLRSFFDAANLVPIGRAPDRDVLVPAVLMRVVIRYDASVESKVIADQVPE